jgi:hypothetical protein
MSLTDEQKRTLSENLAKRWTRSARCIVCGQSEWTVSERLFELREVGGAAQGGSMVALVALTCPGCGYTMLFNASVALGRVTLLSKDGRRLEADE